MKYRDLFDLTCATVDRLRSARFKNPSSNYNAFTFSNATMPLFEFIENERIKLIESYEIPNEDGTASVPDELLGALLEEFQKILDLEIEADIPKLSVSEEDFENDNICYPKEKELWISGEEIGRILKFKEKQKA